MQSPEAHGSFLKHAASLSAGCTEGLGHPVGSPEGVPQKFTYFSLLNMEGTMDTAVMRDNRPDSQLTRQTNG